MRRWGRERETERRERWGREREHTERGGGRWDREMGD